jgi:hypothetical protein
LSAQLRKSVAGFRLPDYGSGANGATSSKLPALAEPPAPVIAAKPLSPTKPANPAKLRKASGIGA